MLRSTRFGVLGGLLSIAAPLGLLTTRVLHRHLSALTVDVWRRELSRDRVIYALGLSSAAALAVFGFIIGRLADRLAELSERDALTGLYNVRRLRQQLQAEMARATRYRTPLSLLLIDVDGLKGLNDRFGHVAGDRALQHVAVCLRGIVRASDSAGRWGGDEFAVIAPHTSANHALALANRLREAVFQDRPLGLPVTIAIGVATVDFATSQGLMRPDDLFHGADGALYRAKWRGGDSVCVAPPARQHDEEIESSSARLRRSCPGAG